MSALDAKSRVRHWRLPANTNRDGAQVCRDVIVLAVQVAELDVEIHIGADLAGDRSPEVIAELVLAGVQKLAIDRQAAVEAVAPPDEKRIAR